MDNMNNKTNVIGMKEFLAKYHRLNSEKARELYVAQVVKHDTYVPYEKKVVVANTILQVAHFDKYGKFMYNSPKEYQIYVFQLITMYTNIILEKDLNTTEAYNDLNEMGIIDQMVKKIEEKNEKDFEEFEIIFEKCRNDFKMNHAETRVNTDDIINAVQLGIMKGIDFIMDQLIKAANNNEFNTILANFMNNNQEVNMP